MSAVILVNERQGYRVCLRCHETMPDGREREWASEHVACTAAERRAAA